MVPSFLFHIQFQSGRNWSHRSDKPVVLIISQSHVVSLESLSKPPHQDGITCCLMLVCHHKHRHFVRSVSQVAFRLSQFCPSPTDSTHCSNASKTLGRLGRCPIYLQVLHLFEFRHLTRHHRDRYQVFVEPPLWWVPRCLLALLDASRPYSVVHCSEQAAR